MSKEFAPNFHTPKEDFSKEELNKLAAGSIEGNLYEDLRDDKPDVIWETEQLAKCHGIYLEFDRAKTGNPKDWSYLVRFGIPGGGPISAKQWRVLDDLSERFTVGNDGTTSMRLTTRQNIQFHWVKKENLVELVRTVAETGIYSLNGCGDNARNVMACPLSSEIGIFDSRGWAEKTARFFRLPIEPFIKVFAIDPNYLRQEDEGPRFSYGPNLLNRKFKIAFTTIIKDPQTGELVSDNCIEMRTHDMGIAPILDEQTRATGRVSQFQIYVGGGQGEKNGKPSLATLALPLGIVTEEQLLPAMNAVVQVHQEWGDRQNRHWARLKYVIKKMGVAWFREKVEENLGFKLQNPQEDYDVGQRFLHHGWSSREGSPTSSFGAFIENGRLSDSSENGRLKSMVREVSEKYKAQLSITANQDIIFSGIPNEAKQEFEDELGTYGYGHRDGKAYSTLRRLSGACVGRDTCRLAYTDSEKFEPELMDQLEALGWGDLSTSIGVTGCERQCFRPATKAIALIGTGFNRYQMKLLGTEDARNQGYPITSEDGQQVYLKSIPREKVAEVIDTLLRFYKEGRNANEEFGYFIRRKGIGAVIEHLSEEPVTKELMDKPQAAKAGVE